MAILTIPRRFALIAKAWNVPTTSEQAVRALGLDKGNLNKFATGKTNEFKNPEAEKEFIERLPNYLESLGVLSSKNLSAAEFKEILVGADDLNFLELLAKPSPVPDSVTRTDRAQVDILSPKLAGFAFLYRLGLDRRTVKTEKANQYVVTQEIVLRRIPVRITDNAEHNFLTYEDRYSWYGQPPNDPEDNESAHGYVFWARSSVCIFAEDLDEKKQADLFMMQVNLDPKFPQENIRSGIIAMIGDSDQPTAGKILLRTAPAECNQMDWDDFASKAELRVSLEDNDKDGIFRLSDTKLSNEEQFNGQKLGNMSLTDIANELQIRFNKVHVTLGDGDFD